METWSALIVDTDVVFCSQIDEIIENEVATSRKACEQRPPKDSNVLICPLSRLSNYSILIRSKGVTTGNPGEPISNGVYQDNHSKVELGMNAMAGTSPAAYRATR